MNEIKNVTECASVQPPEAAPGPLMEQYQHLLSASSNPHSGVHKTEDKSFGGFGKVTRVELEHDGHYIVAFPGSGTPEKPETIAGGVHYQEDHYKYDIYQNPRRESVAWVGDFKNGGTNVFGKFDGLNGGLSSETGQVFDNNNHEIGAFAYTFNPDGQVTSCKKNGTDMTKASQLVWSQKVE